MPTNSSSPRSTSKRKLRSWPRSARAVTRPPSRRRSALPERRAAPATRTSAKSSNNEDRAEEAPLRRGFRLSDRAMIYQRIFCALLLFACAGGANAQDARRGGYLAKVGDCIGCHTEQKPDAIPYAGGRALTTPFGTFYGTNITPDPKNGIGGWSEADFFRAMQKGTRPDGWPYFPAFPYPSFTKITDGDLRDLWAYLRSLPPSTRANHPHELRFPF